MSRRSKKKDICPECGPATFHARVAQSDEMNEFGEFDNLGPVWECGNCRGTKPRRIRRTKGQIALAKLRSSQAYRDAIANFIS